MRKWPRIALILIACAMSTILILGFSEDFSLASDIGPSFSDDDIDLKTAENLPFPNIKMANDFFAQLAKNSRTKGWLAVPNLCYYPVMFSGDNDFYLNHDSNDQENKHGALFLNGGGTPDFNSGVTLIHGHHMKIGTMFGHLKNYMDRDFFQGNRPIEVFDGKNLMFYQPFTVYLMVNGQESIELDEKPPEEHRAYMESLFKRSTCKMANPEEFDPDAKALFLSTCDYTFKEARLVVAAFLIKTVPYEPEETTSL